MLLGIGPMELIAEFVIALVVFSPKRLPDLGRSLGRGMREFKNSITGGDQREELPARYRALTERSLPSARRETGSQRPLAPRP